MFTSRLGLSRSRFCIDLYSDDAIAAGKSYCVGGRCWDYIYRYLYVLKNILQGLKYNEKNIVFDVVVDVLFRLLYHLQIALVL